MKTNSFNLKFILIVSLYFFGIANYSFANENIIQQENMSFEQCLKVISTSEDKLSIAPKITNDSDYKSSAVFTLSDGILTITCDGQKGVVTVTTEMD